MKEAMRQGAFWKGLVVGVVVGLIVAWGIWPLRYTQAYPRDLRLEDRLTYILLVAKDYQRTGDVNALAARLRSFDRRELPDLLQQAEQRFGTNAEDAAALAFLREVVVLGRPPEQAVVPTPTPAGAQALSGGAGRLVLYFLIGLGSIIVALFLAYMIIAARKGQLVPATPPPEGVKLEPVPVQPTSPTVPVEAEEEMEEEETGPSVSWGEMSASPEAPAQASPSQASPTPQPATSSPQSAAPPALRQVDAFQSVFIMQAQGDQTFDDVFTIYDEQEKTLGECGVAEAETLHNQPGHPTVMEIWLFDKQDTTTHQAFILSPWAARQPEIRSRYEEMGPIVVARAGEQIRLTARALFLEAEIKDVAFAQSGEGDEVFNKLALTITVYQRITTSQPSA